MPDTDELAEYRQKWLEAERDLAISTCEMMRVWPWYEPPVEDDKATMQAARAMIRGE